MEAGRAVWGEATGGLTQEGRADHQPLEGHKAVHSLLQWI